MKKILVTLMLSIFLVSCANAEKPLAKYTIEEFENSVDLTNVQNHINELSSPKYNGRASGSKGNTAAANYISSKFSEYSIAPTNDGTYFKSYNQPYTRIFDENVYFNMTVGKNDNAKSYRYSFDLSFIIYESYLEEDLTLSIVKYSEQTKDYTKNVVLQNYAINKTITNSPLTLFYNYPNISFPNIEYGQGELFARNTGHNQLAISSEAKDKIIEQIDNNQNELTIKYKLDNKSAVVNNVLGVIDNQKSDWIMITSHFDHVGRFDALEDGYFPGALDNASGVASMLEFSRILSTNRKRLDYNYLFVAFNGEEAGLFGSKDYANNPYIELNKVKWMCNIDMIGGGSDDYFLEIPGNHSITLKNTIKTSLKKYNISNYKILGNEKSTDHYYLCNKKVPSTSFVHFDERFYHRPGDSKDKINYTILKNQLNMIGNLVINFN